MTSYPNSLINKDIYLLFGQLHSILYGLEKKMIEREELIRQEVKEELLNQLTTVYEQLSHESFDSSSFFSSLKTKLKNFNPSLDHSNRFNSNFNHLEPKDYQDSNLSDFKEKNESDQSLIKFILSNNIHSSIKFKPEPCHRVDKITQLFNSITSPKTFNGEKKETNQNTQVTSRVNLNPIVSMVVPLDPNEFIETQSVSSLDQNKINHFSSDLTSAQVNNQTNLVNNNSNKNSNNDNINKKINIYNCKSKNKSKSKSNCNNKSNNNSNSNSNSISNSNNIHYHHSTEEEKYDQIIGSKFSKCFEKKSVSKTLKVKENQCPMCNQKFTQTNSLKRHIRSHTGEKPFPCSYCEKRFIDKERLKVHIRIHTGEKPFSCNRCGRRFSQKSTVKRHMSVHTGEKPFSCTRCGKGFASRDNLKVHENSHFHCELKFKRLEDQVK